MKAGLYSIFALFVSLGRYINNNTLNHSGFRKCVAPVALAGLVLVGAATCGCVGGAAHYDGPVKTLDDYNLKIDGDISDALKAFPNDDIADQFKGSSGTPKKDIETGYVILEDFIIKIVDADGDGKADDLYFAIKESKDAVDAWAIKDNRKPAEFSMYNPNNPNIYDNLILKPYEDMAYKMNDESESAGGNYRIPDDRRYVIDSITSKDRTTTEGVCLDVVPVIESMGSPIEISASGGKQIIELS